MIDKDNFDEDIVNSYDNDEWNSILNFSDMKEHYTVIAKSSLQGLKSIPLSLSEHDFDLLMEKSEEKGLPVTDIISTLIEKYLSGKITI